MRHEDLRSDAFRQRRPILKAKSWTRDLICLAVLVATPFTTGVSQTGVNASGNPTHDYSAGPHPNPLANPTADANRIMEDSMQNLEAQKRIAQLNLLRQKEMTEDTAKLLQLANEVKIETRMANSDSLSVIELRKVELIEKLARSVHDKMKAEVAN
jgi:hypothetical protein